MKREIAKYVEPLKAAQGDDFVRGLVRLLDGRKFIRWKDSIREVIERESKSDTSDRPDPSDKEQATEACPP